MAMVRETLRKNVCDRTRDTCPALNECGDEPTVCEKMETAFCCPKYGTELAWTKARFMYYFYDCGVGVDRSAKIAE